MSIPTSATIFCPGADKATRMGFRHGGQKCIREEKLWESGIPWASQSNKLYGESYPMKYLTGWSG
ncbi:hypothetical protein [Rhizobium sp. No.120]